MIQQETLTSILRFYKPGISGENFEPYVAVCTLIWETPKIIWVQGLHGTLSRILLREFLEFCVNNNVETVKAHRTPGHNIPFMKLVADHLELDVSTAASTLLSRTAN